MKKIKLITFLTIVLGFAIFSCTNESIEMDNNISKVINAKSIEFVGIEHNIMLDETYVFLKKESSKKSYQNKSSKDKKRSLENFLISRVKANRKFSDRSNEIGIENVKRIFKEKQTFSKLSTYSKKTSSFLSDKEKAYLDSLNEILEKIDFTKNNNIEENISNLEKDIENEIDLSDEQLITLFSATQTAKYSYNYWKNNFKKWSVLGNNSTITLKQLALKSTSNPECEFGIEGCTVEENLENVKDVVKADIGGAVGGAAGAWVLNFVPGAGQVAYGGAIVGGAVAASVAVAVTKLLDYFF